MTNLTSEEKQQLYALLHKTLAPEEREEALAQEANEKFFNDLEELIGEPLRKKVEENFKFVRENRCLVFLDKDGDKYLENSTEWPAASAYMKWTAGWGKNGGRRRKSVFKDSMPIPQCYRLSYSKDPDTLRVSVVRGISVTPDSFTWVLGKDKEFAVPDSLREEQSNVK